MTVTGFEGKERRAGEISAEDPYSDSWYMNETQN